MDFPSPPTKGYFELIMNWEGTGSSIFVTILKNSTLVSKHFFNSVLPTEKSTRLYFHHVCMCVVMCVGVCVCKCVCVCMVCV